MASAWIDSDPVASPPPAVALGVAAALIILAFVGVTLGLHAALRQGGAPDVAGATESVDTADTLTAKPIVELPASAAASNTADNAVVQDADKDDSSDAIEAKTAEAQQVQSTASKSGGDIDQILASPSEKPTAPAKPVAVEAPPPPPVKSDVPF